MDLSVLILYLHNPHDSGGGHVEAHGGVGHVEVHDGVLKAKN